MSDQCIYDQESEDCGCFLSHMTPIKKNFCAQIDPSSVVIYVTKWLAFCFDLHLTIVWYMYI